MARLIPEVAKGCQASERLVFEQFGRDLPDDWIVLHSLELTDHPHKMWGETDIVVISTKGVFVIEVKGGTVSCKNGEWTVTSLNGKNSYKKNESPWGQAATASSSIRSTIFADERFRGCLIGYGVIMPFERFQDAGGEIIQEVLWDKRHSHENLGFFMGRVAQYWEEQHKSKKEHGPRPISKPDIAEIRRLLRPDVESHFSLGSYLNSLKVELLELTAAQAKSMKGMAGNTKTIISGLAGTGKTMLAVDKAKACAEKEGKSVLYVCFNKLLAKHISANIPAEVSDKITVANLHSFYRDVVDQADKLSLLGAARGDERKLYGTVMPEAFIEAALTLDLEPFDVLIVDEAQDVLTPSHLDALDLLVKDGLSLGNWHFFLDPQQDIYGALSEQAQERLQQIGYASYELTANCRNTRPVAVETSVVAGFDCAMEDAIDGPECKPIIFSDASDFESKLNGEVGRLLNLDVDPKDIIILSSRKRTGSLVRNLSSIHGHPLVDLTEGVPSGDHIAFCTIHSFKGLERKCVLAIDIQDLDDEGKSLLHYAGLSRAQYLLVTFLHKDTRPQYDKHLRDFGARLVS